MIICKLGCYACIGDTAEEAYNNFLNAAEEQEIQPPEALEWYKATEMLASIELDVKPITKRKMK